MHKIVDLIESKLKAIIAIIVALMIVVGAVAGLTARHEYVTSEAYQVKKLLDSMEVEGESDDDIGFEAFFLRDIDGDGYTEKMQEIDQALGNQDYMFVELNFKTTGSLKDAKFTIGDSNFKWKTAIISNNIIKTDHIGYTDEVEFNDLNNGTQILLYGKIESLIGSNIHDYDKESTITLTGTYVNDQGEEIEIHKDSKLKVNWYSTTTTSISNDRLTTYNINNAITDDGFKANFIVNVSENTPTRPVNKALMMKRQEAVLEIPELNGYKPTSVEVVSTNLEHTYNETTGILTLTRNAETDEEGNITRSLSRNNSYSVTVIYPIEAYESLGQDSVMFNVKVSGKSTVYNSEKFGDLESSANSTLSVIYKEIVNNPTVPVVRVYDTWNLSTTVGSHAKRDTSYDYRISKENVQNLYDGNVYDDVQDTYPVQWQVAVGEKEKINKITIEENGVDKFNNTTEMTDYEKTVGVYFTNAGTFLGDNGKIELYNEDGGLLETFTKDNWDTYTSSNPYQLNTQSIKVVTTAPVANTNFYVNQIKKLDDEKIVTDYTKEEFKNLTKIHTYAKGNIEVVEGKSSNTAVNQTKTASAYYDLPASVVSFDSSPNEVVNQKPQNLTLTISTSSTNNFEKKWKDGTFLIELPPETIGAEIQDVSISKNNVNIVSTLVYKENKKYFVRIDTANDDPETYTITVHLNVSGNPLYSTRTGTIVLYASNKICGNYLNAVEDSYDLDGDGLTDDVVARRTRSVEWLAAQGLITEEYITEYDDNDSITIAPNIAEIDRADNARVAKVNVSIANNYPETISEIIILGKIPYQGNTFILNNDSLNSEYTANIKGAITVPAELADYAKVYYSENATPTKDLTDSNNGWTQNVTDWTRVKSYLIDLGEYVLSNTGNKVFTYEVEVPAKTGYNKATFATHAVYYCLDTEIGKFRTETQPNKVGLQVVQKYNFELAKNKYGYNDILVPGATYKFTTKDANNNDITRTGTTNANGKLLLNGLYIGREYTLSEISSPNDYILNNNTIKFNTQIQEENDQQNLYISVIDSNFNGIPEVTLDEQNNFLIKAKVQDEAKYTLVINTEDEDGNTIEDVRYIVTANEKEKMYKDHNGTIEIKGFNLDEDYKIQETRAIGYYTDEAPREFRVTRNTETNELEIITEDGQIATAEIQENVEGQSIVTITIRNQKIPTYDLQLTKIEEKKATDTEIKKLANAQFKLFKDDIQETEVYTTDENGTINLTGLYCFVEEKQSQVTGKYTLQEIKAPDGYSNNAEEIEFFVEKVDDDLYVYIENETALRTLYKSEIEDGTLQLTIQDKPLFKLTKVDSEQVDEYGNPILLPNAEFVIYELNNNGAQEDFAKDVNGNYVGEYDEESGLYIVTTDENGNISIPLRPGAYMIKEVGYPEGYYELDTTQVFRIAESEKETETLEVSEEISGIVEINYIEDLVEFSNNVNSGTSYYHAMVKLMRTLDFNDDDSYRNSRSRIYGDINENGIVENLKTELTTGNGFKPIGGNGFNGIFDGQNYEIQNLYINQDITSSGTIYVGLFRTISGAEIYNLGITGSVTGKITSGNNYTGALLGYATSGKIVNCYNKAEVLGGCAYVGGLIGYSSGLQIYDCYNEGNVTGRRDKSNDYVYAGGLIGYKYNCTISNCYNTGEIKATNNYSASYAGGLFGYEYGYSGRTTNCYNTGKITAESYSGGIAGYIKNGILEYSYNNGEISGSNSAGGIVGYTDSITINQCYNNGLVKNASYTGGLLGYSNKSTINNSYNIASIGSAYRVGGLVGYANNGTINNSYNIGDVNGSGYAGLLAGYVISSEGNAVINNSYYLDSITISASNINRDGISKTATEMKSMEFITELGEEIWKQDISNVNNGYPIHIENETEEITNNYVHEEKEINYIEDLLDLSNEVKAGKSYRLGNVKLMRTLDFNDDESYRDASSNSYGDINGDEQIDDIKTELTTGIGFIPIGENSNQPFSGFFDGQGFEIRNLYINAPENNYVGVFGYVNKSEIKNLKVTGNLTGRQYVGGIIGYSHYTNIDNCYSNATLKGTNYIGGIVGNSNGNNASIISNCYSEGTLSTNGSYGYIGGIVGENNGNTISNCYNTVLIEGKNSSISYYVGGIAGKSSGRIEYCYNTAKIDLYSSSKSCAGGIVGSASGTIISCYNTGEIIAYCYNPTSSADAGGIAGYSSATHSYCYNTGKVTAQTSRDYCYAGGITGRGGTTTHCYNNGEINGQCTIYSSTYTGGGYTGGITGSGSGKITYCYNTGNVIGYTTTPSSTRISYVGGIVGINSYSVECCYNEGNVNGSSSGTIYIGGISGTAGSSRYNCYNRGNITSTSRNSYVAGITADMGYYTMKNCYSTGDISGGYVGELVFTLDTSGKIINSYYLDGITVQGTTNKYYGEKKSIQEMCSKDFYLTLNTDNVWQYNVGDYPTLKDTSLILTDIQEATEITVENTIKKYNITVENLKPEGGTIEGENEVVLYKGSNENSIKFIPNEGYEIVTISINEKNIMFEKAEDGSYTIPAGFFTNVTEDKNIQVNFAATDNIFTLNKVDEDDNTKVLEGAKFRITNDSRSDDLDVIGEIVNNGQEYHQINTEEEIEFEKELIANGTLYQDLNEDAEVEFEKSLNNNGITYNVGDEEHLVNDVLGEISDNGNEYTFELNESNAYVSNNKGKAATANSYFEIDLTEKTGEYVVVVNANVSSYSSDYGYATITTTNDVAPEYDSAEGRFIYISGTGNAVTTPTDYTSAVLEGGNKYYLYLGYRKASTSSSGSDVFTVNSINVYEKAQKQYGFEEVDGAYVPNNIGKRNTRANTCIPIDLTEKEGNYFVRINAQNNSGNSSEYLYAVINESTDMVEPTVSTGRFVNIYSSTAANYVSSMLEGGKQYYLHLGFTNVNGLSKEVKINSIKLYEEIDKRYNFIEQDGAYVPNNIGKLIKKSNSNSIARSYIPIDLTDKEGNYYISINSTISGNTSYESLVANVTKDSPTASTYCSIMSTYSNGTSTFTNSDTGVLKGGAQYYLHLSYTNADETINTVRINSIKMYKSIDYHKYFENIDGRYVSNNTGLDGKIANSYIPIDLTGKTGKYDLTVNAKISSQRGYDFGYATVSNSTTTPAYSNTSGRFIYISGDVASKDYTTTLNGGSLYYLHLGYYKNDSVSYGDDKFTINEVKLSLNRDSYLYKELTTDANGQIKLEASGDTTLYITEIEAPKGYTLNSETRTYTMVPGETNSMTLTNKKQTKLTVHHYLKDTTNKIAEDDILLGDIGAEYETEPKLDLENLVLAKDNEGKFILPENAKGTYGADDFEIAYYYELQPIVLTIHYYLDGTEDKYAEDRIIENTSELRLGENGIYSVVGGDACRYVLNEDPIYANTISYVAELVEIQSTIKDDISIDDVLEYETDSEITFIYRTKQYKYTVNYYYDGVKDEDATEEIYADYQSVIDTYPDKIKTGFRLDHIDNEGLIISVTEDENIMDVYYVSKTFDYTVTNEWVEMPEDVANTYRVTVKLQKKQNNSWVNVLDENGKIVTGTIIGNSNYVFEDVLQYIDGQKITYQIVQTKIEKTNNNGETWSSFTNARTTIGSQVNGTNGNISQKITNTCLKTYAVRKEWLGVSSSVYWVTLDLYKTVGGIKQAVSDSNVTFSYNGVSMSNVTRTPVSAMLRGNTTLYINNLPKYENGEEILYTVEERDMKYGSYNLIDANTSYIYSEHNYNTGGYDDYLKNKYLYKITTEIGPDIQNIRQGGTITGVYNDEYLEENHKQFVENVPYGGTASTDIEIIPDEGFKVYTITINNDNYEFEEDDDGKVIIPKEYLTNITSNTNVVVKFIKLSRMLNIVKIGEKGERLSGAKFDIVKASDPSSNIDDVGNIIHSGIATNELSHKNSNFSYYFEQGTDGTYRPNNMRVSNSTALSYVEVDLSNSTRSANLCVNARISSESGCDIGAVYISETSPSSYNLYSGNNLISISGTQNSYDYTTSLSRGRKYYIYFTYRKDGSVDSGEDAFVINSIKIDGVDIDGRRGIVTDENGEASIELKEYGEYILKEIKAPPRHQIADDINFELIDSEDNQTITVQDELIQYDVIIEGFLDSNGNLAGNVTGEYTENYPEGGNKKLVESIKYGYSATKDITIQANTGYYIQKITINNNDYSYTSNDGVVTIPKTYFQDITQNYNVKVYLAEESKQLKIIKTEEDESRLSGAQFEVIVKDGEGENVSDRLSSMNNYYSSASSYSFDYNTETGTYESTNNEENSSASIGYMELNLYGYEGKYKLKVDADISSESSDIGYVIVTDSYDSMYSGTEIWHEGSATSSSSSSSSSSSGWYEYYYDPYGFESCNYIMKISGETHEESEIVLEGGRWYYVFFVYVKDYSGSSRDDKFTINNVEVYNYSKYTDITNSNGETTVNLKGYEEYVIDEIRTPSHYITSEPIDYELVSTDSNPEVTILNEPEQYDITTQIVGDASKVDITGEYNDVYTEANNKRFVEKVKYKRTLSQDIDIDTDIGYEIKKITINGSAYDFTENENDDGSITIPRTRFANVSSNMNIVATVGPETKTLKIEKVDEEGNKLEGAKFKIAAKDYSVFVGEIQPFNTTYYFEQQEDGSFVPNNKRCRSTTAVSYNIVDLTSLAGTYEYTVNAKISSERNCDMGWLVASTNTPTDLGNYSAYNPSVSGNTRFAYVSGNTRTDNYTTELQGGLKYYIYYVYSKDGSVDSLDDEFRINSIKIKSKDTSDGMLITTDENGEAEFQLTGYGDYTYEEVEAPEHYIKITGKTEFELLPTDFDRVITVENERKSTVTVHHYYKDLEGNYTTNKVAEDVILEGAPGENYEAEALTTLTGLAREKNNDELVVPTGATGLFTKAPKEVTYYYELLPITLTIHHKKVETNESLADDEVITNIPDISFPTDGTYSINSSFEYDLNANNTYRSLLTRYELQKIATDTNLEPDLNEPSNISYNLSKELTYYYKDKPASCTIHYKEKDTENTVAEDKVVEDRDIGDFIEESAIDIPGYNKVISDTVNIEITDIETEYTFYYTKRTDLSYTVHYKEKDTENTVAEDKVVDDQTFGDTIQESAINVDGYDKVDPTEADIEITANTNEYTFYYTRRTNLSYTVHYIEQGTTNTVAEDKVVNNQTFGDTIQESAINVEGYEKVNPTTANIEITLGTNEATFYYTRRTDLSYKVYYKEKDTEIELAEVKAGYDKTLGDIIEESAIDIEGYDKVDPTVAQIEINSETNEYVFYYTKRTNITYTINYINRVTHEAAQTAKVVTTGTYLDTILAADEVIVIPGYEYYNTDKDSITLGVDSAQNVINLYYTPAYTITTFVEEHTEKYRNGTTGPSVTGGTISGQEDEVYENVLNGENATKNIVITPNDGYQIARVTVTAGNITKDLNLDYYVDENGVITIKPEEDTLLQNITSNISIEAEFRKESKVTVKYINKETNEEIANAQEILGLESKTFEPTLPTVAGYRRTRVSVGNTQEEAPVYVTIIDGEEQYIEMTDENNTMSADPSVLIYWYEPIPEGTILVRHIEVDESDINGTYNLDSGTEISVEEIATLEEYQGQIGTTKPTSRKEFIDSETGRAYISVDGPISNNENILVMDKDTNDYVVTIEERDLDNDGLMDIQEVRYYYERQYEITVKDKSNEGMVSGLDITVDGGHYGMISGDGENAYELVNRMGSNTKVIEAVPNEKYIVKLIKVNGLAINIAELTDETGKVTIPAGYFTNIVEDIEVEVFFEKAPGKVIVRYVDKETNEELDKEIIVGIVDDEYKANAKEIDGYKLDESSLPENTKGPMTVEDIEVVYYYKKIEKEEPIENPDKPETPQEPNKPEDNSEDNSNIPEPTEIIYEEGSGEVTEEVEEKEVELEVIYDERRLKPTHRGTPMKNPKSGDNVLEYVEFLVVSTVSVIMIKIKKALNKKKKDDK